MCSKKQTKQKILSQWPYEYSSNFLQLSTIPSSDLSFASCLGSCVYHPWLGTIVMHALNNYYMLNTDMHLTIVHHALFLIPWYTYG